MPRTLADVKAFMAGHGELALRRVGPEAAVALATLSAETFRLAYESLHSAENIAAYCAATFTPEKLAALLDEANIHCEVAFLDDEAVGFAVTAHHDGPMAMVGPASELKRLYILPRVYGTGVGRALFKGAVLAARAAGRRHMWLSVADINIRGRPFYDKLGFAVIGVGPTFMVGSDRVTSTLMARKL